MKIGLALSIALSLILCAQTGSQAQAPDPIHLKRSSEPIVIDGELSERSWFQGSPARDFWEYFPSDSIQANAKVQTEVYMTYDDDYLYIGAICHTIGKDYVITSLKRDFRAGGNDNITFVIDPFRDFTNAFVFGMNPYGVMREALISNGGNSPERDWNGSWDNKWRGESRIYDDRWTCELAIPFSTLRYKQGETRWNFNCYRFDMQSNTRTTWNRIPQNQIIMSLAYLAPMVWDEPLKKPGANVSIIPYASGSYRQTYMEEIDDQVVSVEHEPEFNAGFGGDAKIGITPGLNLDLTVNPDFSQVEVDEQVLNLTRFELFFPERRQFFLENADLFGSFGDGRTNPFFSRRIGIGTDTLDESIQIPILFGARLSGKLDNNWRVGLLNMQTQKDDRGRLPGYNYSVGVVQRKLFSRSNIGFIFVNKQTFQDIDADTLEIYPYNRVMGLEYNLASADNVWNGKLYYQHSFSPVKDAAPYATGGFLEYRVRPFRLQWRHRFVGEGFNAEVGFVPRTNYFQVSPEAQLYFYPKSGKINQHGPGAETRVIWQPGFGKADHELSLYWDASFRNTADLRVSLKNEEIFLFEPFDPSRTEGIELPDSTAYNFTYLEMNYRSDRRPKFTYSVRPSIGQFYNGYGLSMGGSLGYRYQPYGGIELNFNYTYIALPEPYTTTGLFLIGPRIDLTLTRSLFLTAFLQYNDQIKNFNINTRLQWRFAPVSDLFIVYTDNYFTETGLQIRNRSIVAKVTYWLNL